MAKDEVIVCREGGTLRECLELGADSISHRNGAEAAAGLRRAERAANVGASDAQLARKPVHVVPAQPEQLPLAQSGHGCGQVQRSLERAERIARNRGEDRLDLLEREEADVWVALILGLGDSLDRIVRRPPLVDR